ncbi:IS1249 family transposase [Falsarthrobacter nasiphocae]|nr:IS1249 family transposase [Falsarthrobacter nasiphocae]
MPLPANRPRCGVCAQTLIKNGTTSAGRPRYRCSSCGASTTPARRDDLTRAHQIHRFEDWLLGRTTQGEHGPARTFRRQHAWCWNVAPEPVLTGEVHRVLMLDGTYFNTWCALVAYTGEHVVAWQFCDREKRASWAALLEMIPAPDIVIVDGNAAALTVIGELWPATRVQRCLFHLLHRVDEHLTRRPVLQAGRQLRSLARALPKVSSLDQAASWEASLAAWHGAWRAFLTERTYARAGLVRPSSVPVNAAWWYTHQRLRRAYFTLERVRKAGHLFTWLEQARPGEVLPRTTSPLEGGVNAGLKELFRSHRGIPRHRAPVAAAWYFRSLSVDTRPASELIRAEHYQAREDTIAGVEEVIGPELWGHGFSWEDGNGTQQGWAGRP